MKLPVILLALHLLAVAYIECTSTVARKDINVSSEVNGSERSLHNRQNDGGRWEYDQAKHNVMITWKLKAETMEILYEEEIGVIKDQWLYYKCSGVVIAPRWVITAASCFQPSIRQSGRRSRGNFLFSPAGGLVSSQFQNRSIESVYVHTDYIENARKGNIDIALVQLGTGFNTNSLTPEHVSMARLAENFAYSTTVSENRMRNCRVISYGEHAVTAEPPFRLQSTMHDVRAAGPKYCEIAHRGWKEPWYEHANPMKPTVEQENDFFDSFFVCATAYEWYVPGGSRRPARDVDLGCFGAVGGGMTCRDADVLVAVQSQRFDLDYCEDEESYSTFTSVGDPRVYDWIKKYVRDVGALHPLYNSTGFPYVLTDSMKMPTEGKTAGDDDDTSSTTRVSTCRGLIVSLALTIIVFTV